MYAASLPRPENLLCVFIAARRSRILSPAAAMTYLPLMAREDIPPCHTEEAALTVDTHNGLSG